MPNCKKFWNWQQPDDQTAELLLYGDISESSWWGDEITPKQFNDELADILNNGIKNIVVRINSGGGDVFAANAIYCRLKDSGAKVTAKIDGWAGSAATIIAMAADNILIPANGVFMIHNPKMLVIDYMDATSCRKVADTLDTIKNSIVNAYISKTGKEENELANLMEAETWYTGVEAIEAGFCDGLMFAEDEMPGGIENKALGGLYFVNKIQMKEKDTCNMPEKIKNMFTAEPAGPVDNKKPNKEGKEMEIKNLEDLKAAAPTDVLNSLQQEAITAERQRIANINSNTLAGCEDLAKQAIEQGTSYADFAIQQVEAVKNQQATAPTIAPAATPNNAYQAAAAADAAEAGLGGVNATPQPGQQTTPHDAFMAVLDSVAPKK